MTKSTRTKLFLLFIAIFFIVTPTIAFYATGYKVNLTWPLNIKHIIQKTGMLIIETEPTEARIYLNDKPQEIFFKKYFSSEINYVKTPAKIKNLLPGEYDIRLEISGYWPWHKKLEIKPGESTFIEDVYLFKKEIPQQIVNFSASLSSQSPNKKILSVLNEKELKIIDDNENVKTFLINENIDNAIIKWSNDSKKILILLPLKNFLINIENDEIIDLNKLLKSNIYNLKWDKTDSNIFYYEHNNKINSYKLNSKKNNNLISNEDYIDYLTKENYIYYVSKINKTYKLKVFSLNSNEVIRIIDLPCSPDLRLINPNHKYLNLHDLKHEMLYIIDPLSPRNPLKEIITNIKYTKWVDNERLLYANDFEIWYYDFNENKKELLTRISSPINSIIWYKNNNYIIYSTDNSIFTIELDQREKRNINELLKFDSIISLYLNGNNDTLYFTGSVGNQEGLYKLAI